MAPILAPKEVSKAELISIIKKSCFFLLTNKFRHLDNPGNFTIQTTIIDIADLALWLAKRYNFAELNRKEVADAIEQILCEFEQRNPDVRVAIYKLPQTENLRIDVAIHVC